MRLLAAAKRGVATPPEHRPKATEQIEDTTQEKAICKLVSAVVSDFCHTQGIAVQLLATNRDVRALVLSHTRNPSPLPPGGLQRGWRKQTIGALIDDVLFGRKAIRVTDKSGELQLEID